MVLDLQKESVEAAVSCWSGDYMKRNNSSWVCDRLEELIKQYEEAKANTYDDGRYWAYVMVIDDLKSILYSDEY